MEIAAHESSGRMRALGVEQDCVAFALAADGVHAIVDPIAATMSVDLDHLVDIEELDRAGPRAGALLARHRVRFDTGRVQKLRLREGVLELDEVVAIVGAGVRERDLAAPGGLYREPSTTVLRLAGSPRYPLVISDDPNSL